MDITSVRKLSRPALALLSILLLLGYPDDSRAPKRWIAEMAGIIYPQKYYPARNELVLSGLYPIPSVDHSSLSLRSHEIDSLSIYLSRGTANELPEQVDEVITPTVITPTVSPITPTVIEPITPTVSITPTVITPITPTVITEGVITPTVISLYDRCLDVDALPNDEDRGNRFGVFQARRKAQIPVVQDAWTHFYPGKGSITEARARQWLTWAADSAANLHDAFDEFVPRNLNSPLGFLEKVLKNRYSEGYYVQQAPSPAPVRTQQQEVVDELPPPSPEFLAKLKAAQERFEKWKEERGLPE